MRGVVLMRVLISTMMVMTEQDRATVSAVWCARVVDLSKKYPYPHLWLSVFEDLMRKRASSL